MTQGSQTTPETAPASTTVVSSSGEQEKQREDAQAATPAPATESQAPVSTPPTSDEKAPPTSDSAAPKPSVVTATSNQTTVTGATLKTDPTPNHGAVPEPVNEKAEEPEEPALGITTRGPPQPDISEINPREEFYRRALIRDTRLAKFFTWLLLLGFVVLPSTFSKTLNPPPDGAGASSSQTCREYFENGRNNLGNTALIPIGYVCCILNILATYLLWRRRSREAKWLYANLFLPGLINAFSGVVTTLASAFGAHGGFYNPASRTTLIFACLCTGIYGALSLIYGKRAANQNEGGRRISTGAMV